MSNSWPKIKSFNKVWKIDNEQEEDKWNKIINKFIGVIDKHLTNYWCECQRINKLEQRFCTFMGLEYKELEEEFEEFYDPHRDSYTACDFQITNLYKQIKSAQNKKCLATVLQCMFVVLEEEIKLEIELEEKLSPFPTGLTELTFTPLYEEIKALAELHQCFSLTKVENSVTIYPYGFPLLDEQVINKTLEGLEDYPYISEKFKHILTIYQSADSPHEYSDVITNLHKLIEMLFKTILNNQLSFEKQIKNIINEDDRLLSELGKFLKEAKISTYLRTMISYIFDKYKDYSNDFK
ncbi:MAG TPA: hypothetical protein VK211_28020, partial [Kamptonema sp.]|nr:hypothetical protein [Kamptonema sp.]